jgi:hypothetical protein
MVEEYSLEHSISLDTTLTTQNFQFSDAREYLTVNWNTHGPIAVDEVNRQPILQFVNPAHLSRQFPSDAIINSGSSNAIETVIQLNQTPLVALDPPLFVTDSLRPPITTNTFDTNLSIESSSSATPYDTPYEPIRIGVITSPQKIRGNKRRRNEGNPLPGRMCFMITSGAPEPTIQERAPTSESARKKRHIVRDLRACLRCRWMKRTVSSLSYVNVNLTMHSVPETIHVKHVQSSARKIFNQEISPGYLAYVLNSPMPVSLLQQNTFHQNSMKQSTISPNIEKRNSLIEADSSIQQRIQNQPANMLHLLQFIMCGRESRDFCTKHSGQVLGSINFV